MGSRLRWALPRLCLERASPGTQGPHLGVSGPGAPSQPTAPPSHQVPMRPHRCLNLAVWSQVSEPLARPATLPPWTDGPSHKTSAHKGLRAVATARVLTCVGENRSILFPSTGSGFCPSC